MREDLNGMAEALGELYYRDLLSWVKDLHDAHLSISSAFTTLLAEYGQVFPRSKLQLYPRSRPLHGPTAIYWGEIVSLRVRSKPNTSELKKVIRHLPGPFQIGWAFTLAKRPDQADRLLDFDRRRLALNAASRAALAALNHVRNATTRKFPADVSSITVASGLDPDVRRKVPRLPENLLPSGLPPRLTQYLRAGWVGAYTLGLAEEESCELAFEVASNPSAEGLRLELSERKKPRFLRRVQWIHTPSGKVCPKLTDRLMRELHLRESVRPVLSLKELKRRRIATSLARSAGALDSIGKECDEAHRIISEKLAEARTIHLPPDAPQETAA